MKNKLFLFFCCIFTICSCSDFLIPSREFKGVPSFSCNWGDTESGVKSFMKGYSEVLSSENEMIFSDSNEQYDATVAYKFNEGKLDITVVIFNSGCTESIKASILEKFEYEGDLSSTEVYANKDNNSLCSYYEQDGRKVFGFTELNTQFSGQITGEKNGYTWVDLGLPSGLLWATRDVGAENDYEYGDFFAWGEIRTRYNEYEWSTYMYSYMDQMQNIGSNISGSSSYDAARVNWGSGWRMPTKVEAQEIVDCCECSVEVHGDIKGVLVTGPSGASIFLPDSGSKQGQKIYRGFGRFWTANNCSAIHACSLDFSISEESCTLQVTENSNYGVALNLRHAGYAIRPVLSKENSN